MHDLFRNPAGAVSRRDLLQVGGSAALGLGLGRLLERAAAAGRGGAESRPAGAKNVLLLYLYGAVSQIDSFDPKPAAPSEIRGPFRTIPTRVPGTAICELLPGVASKLDRVTLVRSLTQPGAFHNVAMTVTGIARTSGEMELAPRDPKHWPFFGSTLAYLGDKDRKGPPPTVVPPNVILPWAQSARSPTQRAGFHAASLGPYYEPTAIEFRGEGPLDSAMAARDPYKAIGPQARFGFPSTDLPTGITADRFQDRRRLLEGFEELRRRWDRGSEAESYESLRHAALRLCDDGGLTDALDLERESPALRDAYGRHLFGQATLAGRRLLEAGSRIVTVIWDEYRTQNSGWDVHEKLERRMRHDLCPQFDATFCTLLDDLRDRGLLDETLVLVLTEHGRTPKPQGANGTTDGRDHWSGCYDALLAGAGVPEGLVLGTTDAHGAYVKDRPVSPNDMLCTIYRLLGLDPERIVFDRAGRPLPLVAGGRAVEEILRG